jgi:hypothetical protein
MTRHDEVRQILHDSGFKFNEHQTAFDMTDEEVEIFLIEFTAAMSDFGRQLAATMNGIAKAMVKAFEPFRENMERIVIESEKRNK